MLMDNIGLIFKCSKENEKENCPFKFIRDIPEIYDRVLEWRKLSSEKKIEMEEYHLDCVNARFSRD